MLTLAFIRENKDLVLKGLEKRNFKNAVVLIDQLIEKDSARRKTQTLLDQILAETNKISKDIGVLIKAGEVQKAAILKEKTGQMKLESKKKKPGR